MLNQGQSIRSITRHFNVGVATIYRIKKRLSHSDLMSCRS